MLLEPQGAPFDTERESFGLLCSATRSAITIWHCALDAAYSRLSRSGSTDINAIVGAGPLILLCPNHGENDRTAFSQVFRRQIANVGPHLGSIRSIVCR